MIVVQFRKLLFAIVIYLFDFVQICNCNSMDRIYSPQSQSIFGSPDSSITMPLQIKIASSANLLFVSCGISGIKILDQFSMNVLYSKNFNSLYVEAIDIESDGKYLLAGILSKLVVFEIKIEELRQKQQNKEVEIIKQVSQVDFLRDIHFIIYNNFNQLAIVGGRDGHIIIYDISNKFDLNILKQFNTDYHLINNIKISFDSTWIYIANDIKGVLIFKLIVNKDEENKKSIGLMLAATGVSGTRSFDVAACNDNKFIYVIDFFNGFYIAKINDNQINEEKYYPIQLNFFEFWPFKGIIPTCLKIIISSDNNYIFLAVRSQGVVILDNKERDNVKYFQQIKANSLVQWISLSEKEDYLYFSNSDVLYGFERTTAFYNNVHPHLYNAHQARQKMFNARYKWRCNIDKNNQNLLFHMDSDGTYSFKYYGDPYRLNIKDYYKYNVFSDSADIDNEGIYMFVNQYLNSELLVAYQISPLDDSENEKQISMVNPKFLFSLNINKVQISEMIKFSYDRTFAVQTYSTGLIFYDTRNIFNIKVIKFWENPQFMNGDNQGVAITKDNKWILSTIRLFGLYVLNAEDLNNLVLTDYIVTRGGESVWTSDIYTEYAYLIDGIQGFAVVDLRMLPKIVILSRVNLPSWSVRCILLQNENFILVTQMENDMLTLLDISDKANPQIASTFRYEKSYATGICMPKSEDYIFLGSPEGIITLPLSSKIKVHTEIYEIFVDYMTGKETAQKIYVDDSIKSEKNYLLFKVGQQIQLRFTIIHPENDGIYITTAFRYLDGQVTNLPSYIYYEQFQQRITINVDKDALGSEREKPNKNTLLIKIVIPLNNYSFFYTKLDDDDIAVTNENQSYLILTYLQDANILDSKKQLTQYFDSVEDIQFSKKFEQIFLENCELDFNLISKEEYLDQVINKIMVTLIKSYYINPIFFYAQSTLSINFNNQNSYISSLSQDIITMQISIPQQYGKFVPSYYPSVVTSYSELQDEIQLKGSLEYINKVLEQSIIFSNSTEFPTLENTKTSYNVTITITDNLNNPIKKSQPIQFCKFITLQPPLSQNSQQRLQNQLENQYTDGILFIETEVLLSFSQTTFLNAESQTVKYHIQYSSQGSVENDILLAEYKDIEPNFWLQSQSDDRLAYKGIIKSSQFGDVYFFKVTADNGYTQTQDYFYVQLKGISFTYVVNILIQVLGPLFAVLGLYGKRTSLYNMINKKKVFQSQENISCDALFEKKIIILGNTYQHSNLMVKSLFSCFMKISSSNPKDLKTQNLLDQNKLKKNQNQNIEQDQFKKYIKLQFNLSKKHQKLIEKQTIKIKTLISSTPTHIRKTYSENKYLDEKGQILTSQIILDLIMLNIPNELKQKYKWQQDYLHDLKNPKTSIYQGTKSLSSRQLLVQDKKSYLVYQYIKFFSIYRLGQQQNDYYKVILNFNFNTNQNNINYNPFNNNKTNQILYMNNKKLFPQIEFKEEVINMILETLITKENNQNQEQLQSKNQEYLNTINMHLIKEVITADVYGFTSQPPTSFFPCLGESIHLHNYEIKQIIAKKKVQYSKWIMPIARFFNLDYIQYGFSKNLKLPKWLNLDLKHSAISLSGIPESEDIEELLIQVYDISEYIILQFKLNIQPNNNYQFDSLNTTINDDTLNLTKRNTYQRSKDNIVFSQFNKKSNNNNGDEQQQQLLQSKQQISILEQRKENQIIKKGQFCSNIIQSKYITQNECQIREQDQLCESNADISFNLNEMNTPKQLHPALTNSHCPTKSNSKNIHSLQYHLDMNEENKNNNNFPNICLDYQEIALSLQTYQDDEPKQ